MQTNVTAFADVCYAVTYDLTGGRLSLTGTHRADRAGVRRWLAAGRPRSGWRLVPAAGTAPGFYAKPYQADIYYRVDPQTGAFQPVGSSLFDDRRPGDEPGGPGAGTVATRYGGTLMQYTGAGMLLTGVVAGGFALLACCAAR